MTGVFDPYREWLGIDSQEHPVDHYRLLGLQRFESDVAVINQAADACMVEVRLHQLGPHGRHTQQLLNEISTARVCLGQVDSRIAYDAQLAGDVAPTVRPLGMSRPPASPSLAPVPPPAPVMSGQERPRKAAATRSAPGELGPEEGAGSSWKIVVGLVGILLIVGGIWGFGWWSDRQSTPQQESDKAGKIRQEDPLEELPVEVVVNQEATGAIELIATVARLHGETIHCQVRGLEGQIENWTNPDEWISWKFRVVKPGFFKAYVSYAATAEANQGTYFLQVNDEAEVMCTVTSPGGTAARTDEYTLVVKKGGVHRLSVKAGEKPGEELLVLKSIRLVPVAKP